jgi:hypothetical protein
VITGHRTLISKKVEFVQRLLDEGGELRTKLNNLRIGSMSVPNADATI